MLMVKTTYDIRDDKKSLRASSISYKVNDISINFDIILNDRTNSVVFYY
jgi:hypothetical protein